MAKFAEPDTGELRRKPIRRSSHSGHSRKLNFALRLSDKSLDDPQRFALVALKVAKMVLLGEF